MKLGKAFIKNFGAYKELNFDFSNQGLSLISGPTKAGKSTIMDIACWLLFGVTSKDSAADDMRSWFTDEATEGHIEVDTPTGLIEVHRKRGKPSENDLCWFEGSDFDTIHRGKDLKDTQRLIEERIGVSAELYIIGSYMHQFSNADTFFIAKAKERREVLEKLADLSLPIKLGTRASEVRKEKKKELEELNQQKAKTEGKLEQTEKTRSAAVVSYEKYESQRTAKIRDLVNKSENFETERKELIHEMVSKIEMLSKIVVDPAEIDGRMEQIKTQIKSLDQAKKEFLLASKKQADLNAKAESAKKQYGKLEELVDAGQCPTCSGPTHGNANFAEVVQKACDLWTDLQGEAEQHRKHYNALEQAVSVEKKIHVAYDKCRDDKTNNDQMIKDITELRAKVLGDKNKLNHYEAMIEMEKVAVNPHEAQIADANSAIVELQASLEDTIGYIKETEHLIASLTWLYDKSFELRAAMLERAKNEIADKTNAYLEKYFDAELRIKLTFDGADKLNVDIINEGYSCPYKQLSGGERCMLKLAFNLALMKRAEDVAGVKFSTVMLDEALNGLDASLKTKAFNLLQTLENDYETILLIDHFEEFKNLFTNRFEVEKVNGYSVLRHE